MLHVALSTARQLAKALLEPFVWPVQQLRAEANSEPLLPLLLLVALLWGAVRAVRGDRVAALVLVPLSFAWVLFNGPLEGPVLFVLSWAHGVTLSDLISVVCLAISAWRLMPVPAGR
jgi:hypothetical protein